MSIDNSDKPHSKFTKRKVLCKQTSTFVFTLFLMIAITWMSKVEGQSLASIQGYVLVNCAMNKSDAFCAKQNQVDQSCCAMVTLYNATTDSSNNGYYCLSREIAGSLGTYSTQANSSVNTLTYSCVRNSNTTDPTFCTTGSDCQKGECCAVRGVEIVGPLIGKGTISQLEQAVCVSNYTDGISGIIYQGGPDQGAYQQTITYARTCIAYSKAWFNHPFKELALILMILIATLNL